MHKQEIESFLKTILIPQKKVNKKFQLFGGFMQRRIPEKLLTAELIKTGNTSFLIDGENFKNFKSVYRNLRKDISTEYLRDKELDDALWYLLCDVYLNRKMYTNSGTLNKQIDEFIGQVCRPLKEYEVLFGVRNLIVKKYPLKLWNTVLTQLDVKDLEHIEPQISGKFKDMIFETFLKNASIMVTLQGNHSGLVIDRAREEAEFIVKVLQTYLNENMSIRDENLLFDISAFSLIRVKDGSKWAWSWRRKRLPYGITISDTLFATINKANEHFEIITNLNPDFRARVQRAIYWVGSSIKEEVLDHKMIFLCTALETLLTSRDDKRKGEIITYRMVLLNHLIKGHFPDPFQLMWFYELRSQIVHGSAIGKTTNSDYSHLQHIVTETLLTFIIQVEKSKVKEYSKLLESLEDKENLKLMLSYFDKFKGEWPKSLQEILNEKLKKFI